MGFRVVRFRERVLLEGYQGLGKGCYKGSFKGSFKDSFEGSFKGSIVNPRKLEHGFRTISAGISYTLP